MSRRVDADEQGRLQGALSSLTGIAGLIGPGLFTVVFSVLIGPLPGAAFLLAALFLAGAAMVAARVTRGL
jgi:DHA1 family tetracycline resistance protein-like MFS transporter